MNGIPDIIAIMYGLPLIIITSGIYNAIYITGIFQLTLLYIRKDYAT
jgi:hypothetical protein